MGRSTSGQDAFDGGSSEEQPEHMTTVSGFGLDKYEVTVARFRQFLLSYAGPPLDGAGAHPLIPGSGWQPAWNVNVTNAASIQAGVKSSLFNATWTDSVGPNEAKPINMVTWYEAFAFCAWDGGRLPTEAEWEYASAGGMENRLYPWGAAPPSPSLAVFGSVSFVSVAAVGSTPGGNGLFHQSDLAGNVWEWVLDAYDPAAYNTGCNDCAYLDGFARVFRGGSWVQPGENLRATTRSRGVEVFRDPNVGLRCARSGT